MFTELGTQAFLGGVFVLFLCGFYAMERWASPTDRKISDAASPILRSSPWFLSRLQNPLNTKRLDVSAPG